jgi:pimeloyl-ACP methyl ester carboxylesterase
MSKNKNYEYVSFKSQLEFSGLGDFPGNQQFDIPVWKPKESNGNVLIMLHGFLEGLDSTQDERERRHLPKYDAIAERLTKEGYTCVLLPLPFHFERSVDFGANELVAPIERLTKNGAFLYYGGYTQVISDVERLIQAISKKPEQFGLVAGKVEYHMLGYSLGGVAAMGAALKCSNKFKSLSILLSTWNLQNINPEEIQRIFGSTYSFGREQWEKMMDELNQLKNVKHVASEFKYLIWGEGERVVFKEMSKNILFLHGLEDKLFTREIVARNNEIVLESINKCTLISIPAGHFILRERQLVAGFVSEFILNARD